MVLDSRGGHSVVTGGPGRKTGAFELEVEEASREARGSDSKEGQETRSRGPLETEQAGNGFCMKPPEGEPRS